MIIYEEKRDHIEEPKKRTCIKCGSKLGIEKKDYINIPMFDQREGSYSVQGFQCPVCFTNQALRK